MGLSGSSLDRGQQGKTGKPGATVQSSQDPPQSSETAAAPVSEQIICSSLGRAPSPLPWLPCYGHEPCFLLPGGRGSPIVSDLPAALHHLTSCLFGAVSQHYLQSSSCPKQNLTHTSQIVHFLKSTSESVTSMARQTYHCTSIRSLWLGI